MTENKKEYIEVNREELTPEELETKLAYTEALIAIEKLLAKVED